MSVFLWIALAWLATSLLAAFAYVRLAAYAARSDAHLRRPRRRARRVR